MASRRSSVIEAALLKKGFRIVNTHHRYLILYVHDEATDIRTYLSHGISEYGDDLLRKMQRQVHLATKQDLLQLIDCPMSRDEYVQRLQNQGDLDS